MWFPNIEQSVRKVVLHFEPQHAKISGSRQSKNIFAKFMKSRRQEMSRSARMIKSIWCYTAKYFAAKFFKFSPFWAFPAPCILNQSTFLKYRSSICTPNSIGQQKGWGYGLHRVWECSIRTVPPDWISENFAFVFPAKRLEKGLCLPAGAGLRALPWRLHLVP